jgi:hypothetical protein
MQIGNSSLSNLARLRDGVRRERASSWDQSGGNRDFWTFEPGQALTIAETTGAGCIKHIWTTMSSPDPYFARKVVLRMWWDGEPVESPSVQVPIGDFFGIGHAIVKTFWSLPLTMSPSDGRGFNCFFPMPFAESARIEVTNETADPFNLYFYVDYEAYDRLDDGYGRFHAQWRRENPTAGWGDPSRRFRQDRGYAREVNATPNLGDADNYLILEAEGKGQYVGCHLDVDCFAREKNDWYGEGDDMVVIDGEPSLLRRRHSDGAPWPPRLHGTGTEDYFNTAYCPHEEFCTPYHGITVYSGTDEWPWRGKNSLYRFHVEDPIYFERSIRVSIEHGHANNLSNDYSSTAYWYQAEPHKPFPPLVPVEERLPRPDDAP